MSEPNETLYEVVRVENGHGIPVHGGSQDFAWPLPTADGPGEWVSVPGPLQICSNGLHLTDTPVEWFIPGSAVYVAEYRGEMQREGNKVASLEARLLSLADWNDHGIFTHGRHVVRDGRHRAYGSATVEASGSATVEAYGSATVEAYGSATVRASGSATVISTPYHRDGVAVALSQMAAHIDRRGGKLILRGARGGDHEVPA